jgi:hypothetical protein
MKPSAVRRRGRTLGAAAIGALLTAFTAICSVEIIEQAWTPTPLPATTDCRTGVSGLIAAVRRARTAAAEGAGSERDALSRFRQALEPEWGSRTALGDLCGNDSDAKGALETVDRLRYAEEHALRYEALDVAKRRKDVEVLEKRLAASR